MNEIINLCEILKDCPRGTKLYSTIYGQVSFLWIDEDYEYPIVFSLTNDKVNCVTANGMATHLYKGECTLFPSRDQRDWSKWKCPKPKKPKFDPNTLKTFDKVIVKPDNGDWHCSILSHRDKHSFYYRMIDGYGYPNIVPYNEETKHLAGTSDEAPDYYKYWED